MLHLAICGALGRMGTRVANLAAEADDVLLTALIDNAVSGTFGNPAGASTTHPDFDVPLSEKLPDDAKIDVVVDFTLPDGTVAIAKQCAERGAALVSGTTGLSQQDFEALDHAGYRVPVLHATNFSLGVALMNQLVRQAATVLGQDFAVEIVETHHDQKIDAPSGTALTLAENAAIGLNLDPTTQASYTYGRHGRVGRRDKDVIGLHALRGGEVVGEHTVHFLGHHERVEITHRAASRDIFAAGALRAARWLVTQRVGRYNVQQMLKHLLEAGPGS